MVAKACGKTVLETVGYLATSKDSPVKCCYGNAAERDATRTVLCTANIVVLEPSAIATLSLLEAQGILARVPFRCVTTASSLKQIRSLILDDAARKRPHGYLGVVEGAPVMQEIPAEAAAARNTRLEALVSAIEKSCEVVGGSALAALDQKTREYLTKCVTRDSAECVALAMQRGAPIWTDDLALGELSRELCQTSRAWTQAVLALLVDRDLLDADAFLTATTKLVACGYTFVAVSAPTVVHACRLADWDRDRSPADAVLDYFAIASIAGDSLGFLLAHSVLLVWRNAPDQEVAIRIILRMLDRVGQRADGKAIVQPVARNIDNLFGVDVFGASRVRRAMETWLERSGREGIILLP
jgi:hypothetical protein